MHLPILRLAPQWEKFLTSRNKEAGTCLGPSLGELITEPMALALVALPRSCKSGNTQVCHLKNSVFRGRLETEVEKKERESAVMDHLACTRDCTHPTHLSGHMYEVTPVLSSV